MGQSDAEKIAEYEAVLKAELDGREARMNGKSMLENPYDKTTLAYLAWNNSWSQTAYIENLQMVVGVSVWVIQSLKSIREISNEEVSGKISTVITKLSEAVNAVLEDR